MAAATIKAVYLGSNSELEKHVLHACGNDVVVQAYSAADAMLKALETRCIDIVCLDHSYGETIEFLRQFPLVRLTKLYFVIAVAGSDALCRWLSDRGVQYAATHQNAGSDIPPIFKACVSLICQEQRQRPRLAMHMPAMIRTQGEWVPAIISDISESGCRVIAENALSPDSDVSVRFQIGEMDAVMDASAKVIWIDSVGQHGLRFSFIYPPHFRRLRAWLSRTNGRILLPQVDSEATVAGAAHQ